MKKWILIGSAAIIVIVVVVVFVGLSNLGPIMKKAVNTYGPKITKTELHVADVGVSILSAEAKVKAFFLGNPKGFKSPSAMKVGSVFVNVDEKSLTGETIITLTTAMILSTTCSTVIPRCSASRLRQIRCLRTALATARTSAE